MLAQILSELFKVKSMFSFLVMNISVGYLLISFNLSLMQCFEVSKNLKKMIVQGFGDFCQAQSQCKSQLSWTDLALLSVYNFGS